MGQTDGWIAVLLKAPVRRGHDKHQMKKTRKRVLCPSAMCYFTVKSVNIMTYILQNS